MQTKIFRAFASRAFPIVWVTTLATASFIVSLSAANALPSFARQTGQACPVCHAGFPELTPYGRLFKLRGYTDLGPEASKIPPFSMMVQPGFTNTRKAQPPDANPDFKTNNNFSVQETSRSEEASCRERV